MWQITDARGAADIDYDQLMRVTSFSDSNGNTAAYAYDALGRVTRLTPPQGANYKTEYAYKLNGSLSYVDVYDAGSPARTSYTYSTSSGKLTARDFPQVSSQNIRTAYSYDSAGRLGVMFPARPPVKSAVRLSLNKRCNSGLERMRH